MRATGKSMRYYIKLGSITSTMLMDLIVFKNQLIQNEGSRLYLTLYIKQQTWNIFISDRVNIRWLTNKGLVWTFHLDNLIILSFFFVYGKVIQRVVYGGLHKECYNIESKVVLKSDTTFLIH